MKRYAEGTSTPISKTRAEIDKLLRQWGAESVQWSDVFSEDRVVLRFTWKSFSARFDVKLEAKSDLQQHAVDNRSGRLSERKLELLMDARGKQEHRLLLLWIKAALNACAAGIVAPEAIFLPFLEGTDGQTVSEVALPKLAMLGQGSAGKLLGAGR